MKAGDKPDPKRKRNNTSDMMEQGEVIEIEDDKKVMKKLKQENSVLRRRVADLEPEGDIARTVRPGPALKPFEALTPRQQKVASDDIQSKILKTSKERNILPTKLSAFLTYR